MFFRRKVDSQVFATICKVLNLYRFNKNVSVVTAAILVCMLLGYDMKEQREFFKVDIPKKP